MSSRQQIPDTLITPRLTLKAAHPSMAPAVLELHRNNRGFFALGSPRVLLERTEPEFWRRKLSDERSRWRAGKEYCWYGHSEDSGQLICQVQISGICAGVFQSASIGYKIDQQHARQGLMTEAMEACIAFCFDDLNLHRLSAAYQPVNEASAALLKTLGFQVEGYARDYLFINGRWADHILTALINQHHDSQGL